MTQSSARKYLATGAVAAALLIGGFGSWAVYSEISGAVIAQGRIRAENDQQVIQHAEGGVVRSILVEEGDTVAAGDVMLQLDDTVLTAELSALKARQGEMTARAARLEAEMVGATSIDFPDHLIAISPEDADEMIAGQEVIFAARMDAQTKEAESLALRRTQIRAQIDGLNAQRIAAEAQLDIIEAELGDQSSLRDRGLSLAAKLNGLKREKADAEGRIGNLISKIAESEERITEIETNFIKDVSLKREKTTEELRAIKVELAALETKRVNLAEQIARLDVRAPVSGLVHDLRVHALRSVVRPAEELGQIISNDDGLVISAHVDPAHIDQVRLGQDTTLRFSGLNARTTPELAGTVTRVSADAFTDESTGQSYYLIEVEPRPGELAKLASTPPVPGMPVETYIRTEARSPLSYLIKPMADYFSTAMRES